MLLPRLFDTLREHRSAVLQTPPGAGRTIRVPPALLEQPWLPGHRIIVVEPNSLAVRAAASRMASLLGEEVGETVGHRTAQDIRIGARTRIELVTDSLFLRQIQESPELPDVGAVLFDALHERRIDGTLALTFAREAREALCGSTLLLAMSAGRDTGPVSSLLGDRSAPAPVVIDDEHGHPVEIRQLGASTPGAGIEDKVASTVRRALREDKGGVLVFLPDADAIRRVGALLEGADPDPRTLLVFLPDDAPPDALDAAISPSPTGTRKVVLATSLAESGLAVGDVRIVVDSGLERVRRFDAHSGMMRCVTVTASRASAERRSGGAGRSEPGVCYRLWPETAHGTLPSRTRPEILGTDLAPLALELAVWGVKSTADLPWLDAPPLAAMTRARDLLTGLGAIDAAGAITPLGKGMATLGLHPRLARLILSGAEMGLGGVACTVAALLEESDSATRSGARDIDLRLWVDRLLDEERGARTRPPDDPPADTKDQERLWRIVWRARLWRLRIGIHHPPDSADADRIGTLLALAYPDRIARRQPTVTADDAMVRYRLADGTIARLPNTGSLSSAEWLAVAGLDGFPDDPWIALAAPLAGQTRQDPWQGSGG